VTEGGGTLATSVTLAGSITGSVALDAGIMIVQRSAAELFRAHKEGLTWDEDFDTTDMLVVNDDEIRITMTPVPGKPAQQAHDLHKLGSIFMPKFIHNGKMALYFSVLAKDLRNTSEGEVTEDWYREYIIGHTTLRPSIVRYNLIDRVHQACEKFCVANSAIYTFLKESHPFYEDWRTRIPSDSSDAFYKVYWFRIQPTTGVHNLAINSDSLKLVELVHLAGLRHLTIVAPVLKELTVLSCFLCN